MLLVSVVLVRRVSIVGGAGVGIGDEFGAHNPSIRDYAAVVVVVVVWVNLTPVKHSARGMQE